MNGLVLLMVLLILSYLGGTFVDRRAKRGPGLTSGLEVVALGMLIGPGVLGVVDQSVLVAFAPVAHVALGWLAFRVGLEALFLGGRAIRAASALAAWAFAAVTAAAVAAAAWIVAVRLWGWSAKEALLLAAGLGAPGAELARQGARWLAERPEGEGPLGRRLAEIGHAGAVVPLGLAGLLFGYVTPPRPGLPIDMPPWGWIAVTPALGIVLGVVAAVWLARELRLEESWGVLLGTVVFALGLAVRLEISPMSVTFFLGLALAAASRHRAEIVAMVAPTERTVMLPALLLAGAHIDLGSAKPLVLAGAAVAARLFALLGCALVLWTFVRRARPAGLRLAGALASAGTLSLGLALAFALRFPGPLGDAVLVGTASLAFVGELIGPRALRASLRRAGELGATPPPALVSDEPLQEVAS